MRKIKALEVEHFAQDLSAVPIGFEPNHICSKVHLYSNFVSAHSNIIFVTLF